jgi:hypothetical protein
MTTQGKGVAVAELMAAFVYDPEFGTLRRSNSRRLATYKPSIDGRIRVRFQGRCFFAHRVAWALFCGVWPSGVIDHINGDPSDNRIANLRDVDLNINSQNQRKAMNTNKTGFIGVHATYKHGGIQYRARIRPPGQKTQIYLGSFPTAEQANAAYVAAKRELHPGCTL